MDRTFASDLEFDKVLQLIAAHARSGVGRSFLERSVVSTRHGGDPSAAAHLTLDLGDLIEDGETLSFAGIDDALPWLEDDAPPPSEPRDLLALLGLARRVASVRRRLGAAPSDRLRAIARRLPDTTELVAAVSPRLNPDGTVADSASPELQRLRREVVRARTEVTAELEGIRRAHGDVVTDAPPTLRRDRYCLPVRSSARGQLPGLLLDVSGRGATAFVEPLAVVELNNRLTAATAGEQREIQRILAEIARLFAVAHDDLVGAVDVLAEIDAVQAKVLFGRRIEGRVVLPAETSDLVLRGARHPLLDERLHALRVEVFGPSEQRDPGHQVVPLDFSLPEGVRTLVISGPNAGGKTVVLKTIGLMALMCRYGVPLPADEGTTIPDFDRLWCHIGDEQDVAADLSTFSGSMAATARLLDDADDSTLVLFDELGAGTDPLEGAAIGCALLEELSNRGAITVVSTHLASIALSASAADGMENAAVEYDEKTQRPTYVLSVGRPGRSRALEIADRMGVPEVVLDRARELLGGDHLELDRWLRRLEALEMQLEAERSEAALLRAEADGVQHEARRELQKLENERLAIPEMLAAEREELRRRAKKKLDTAINSLQKANEEHEALGRRRLQKLRDEALDLDDREAAPASSGDGLEIGARVRLAVGGKGVLREIRGSQAQVEVADKKLWVPVGDVRVVKGPPPERRAAVRLETVESTDRELKLIGLDSEHAREELERFLDQALTSGLPAVRVVHGHGTGTLRRLVTEICRSHPAVRSFRHPPQHRGGTGATEVELEDGA
ncbi:MAG: Smr/MutS family protein [Acidobacteriota bacterium]|nr:Smr/MutS family protein [Acidobacteriota bacterium]